MEKGKREMNLSVIQTAFALRQFPFPCNAAQKAVELAWQLNPARDALSALRAQRERDTAALTIGSGLNLFQAVKEGL
jgi:hypothetical protein